jgi:hypothetical protein
MSVNVIYPNHDGARFWAGRCSASLVCCQRRAAGGSGIALKNGALTGLFPLRSVSPEARRRHASERPEGSPIGGAPPRPVYPPAIHLQNAKEGEKAS